MSTHKLTVFAAAVAAIIGVGEIKSSGLIVGVRSAHAVIGRPLTPMSYAGDARRTTRRAAYAGAYGGAYARPYYAPSVVTAVPSGCARVVTGAGVTYSCGTTSYRPYYDGPTVVYRPM